MHLTEADIALYVEDKLDKQVRSEVERHLANCSVCVEQVAALARLDEEMSVPGIVDVPEDVRRAAERLVHVRVSNSPGTTRRFWRPARYAMAAVVVFAVGVTYYTFREESQPRRFRSANPSPVISTFSPSDGTVVRDQRPTLVWSAVALAATYSVTLYDLDGSEVWTEFSSDTTVKIPEEVALQPGAGYLWRVEAIFADDTRFRSSLNAFTFSP